MPSFCFVIVNYFGHDDTVACVNSILAARAEPGQARVVIVDNSGEQFEFGDADITVLQTGHNIGLSGAWYVGFYAEVTQSCEYVIFLNNDATVAPDFIEQLNKGAETWGPNCAFGPRIYYSQDRERIWSRGGEIHRFGVKVVHHGENVLASDVVTGDFETGHLSGCCLILRVAHLNQLGGPDTNFFFRGEEWDLNYRFAKAGIRLVILDSANVYHNVNGSHDRFSPAMLYFAYRAKVLFAKKILPVWYFPVWFALAIVFTNFVAARRFAKAGERPLAPIRKSLMSALFEGLRNDKILPPQTTSES
jgi:GT2 family glycosyltransferase